MAAMFTGVFTAFEIANDYETGMGSRFMSAAPRRMAIVAGYVIFGLGRARLRAGGRLGRGPRHGHAHAWRGARHRRVDALALLLNVATTLYGAGVALRLQSTAAAC